MHLRKFVLMPLNEINKKWTHPRFKKNCAFFNAKIKDFQYIKKSKKSFLDFFTNKFKVISWQELQ